MTAHAAALRLRTKDAILVDRLIANYRQAKLDERDRVMLDFSVKLTQEPEVVEESDVQRLREAGFADEDILHLAELTAIFNYNERV